MANIWSTHDILVLYKMEVLVGHHVLNHLTFKTTIILPNRGVIPNNLKKVTKISP